jgi:hypothetical protein
MAKFLHIFQRHSLRVKRHYYATTFLRCMSIVRIVHSRPSSEHALTWGHAWHCLFKIRNLDKYWHHISRYSVYKSSGLTKNGQKNFVYLIIFMHGPVPVHLFSVSRDCIAYFCVIINILLAYFQHFLSTSDWRKWLPVQYLPNLSMD